MFHGAIVFPFTCGICYVGDGPYSPCFASLKSFLKHWKKHHPNIEFASEIIHPEFGNHYSTLPHHRLSQFLNPNSSSDE